MMMYVEGIQNQYELTIVVKPIVMSHGTVEGKDEREREIRHSLGKETRFYQSKSQYHCTTYLPYN